MTTEIVKSKMNKAWHIAHAMPNNAKIEQRIEWHLAHKANCNCRGIPEKLRVEMIKRKIEIN